MKPRFRLYSLTLPILILFSVGAKHCDDIDPKPERVYKVVTNVWGKYGNSSKSKSFTHAECQAGGETAQIKLPTDDPMTYGYCKLEVKAGRCMVTAFVRTNKFPSGKWDDAGPGEGKIEVNAKDSDGKHNTSCTITES